MAETPTDRIKQCLNLHHLDLFCVLELPFSARPNDISFCFAYSLETQTGSSLMMFMLRIPSRTSSGRRSFFALHVSLWYKFRCAARCRGQRPVHVHL